MDGTCEWNNDKYARSLMSLPVRAHFDAPPSALITTLDIEVVMGDLVTVRERLDVCHVFIVEHIFPLTLIPLGVGCFDFVIGMEWLSVNLC